MRDESQTIRSTATFDLITPDAAPVSVAVELTYTSRDPFAVQASFKTGQDTTVDWVFARDLLADGLVDSAGTGDVRVQPMSEDPGTIELELTSPSGHALFTTAAATLSDFLQATYDAVPPAAEYSWLDFDAALADLLDTTARD